MSGVETIIYIDYLLLGILVFLSVFACSYCVLRVYQLRRNDQLSSTNIGAVLRPTQVMFSHKTEGEGEQLRTVVAYRNPLTGDYCVHGAHRPAGFSNASPDSGVSDEYEPLDPLPHPRPHRDTDKLIRREDTMKVPEEPIYDNSLNKTWNWNYKEYQI